MPKCREIQALRSGKGNAIKTCYHVVIEVQGLQQHHEHDAFKCKRPESLRFRQGNQKFISTLCLLYLLAWCVLNLERFKCWFWITFTVYFPLVDMFTAVACWVSPMLAFCEHDKFFHEHLTSCFTWKPRTKTEDHLHIWHFSQVFHIFL